MEVVIMEKFVRDQETETWSWVQRNAPAALEEAVKLTKAYIAVEETFIFMFSTLQREQGSNMKGASQ